MWFACCYEWIDRVKSFFFFRNIGDSAQIHACSVKKKCVKLKQKNYSKSYTVTVVTKTVRAHN